MDYFKYMIKDVETHELHDKDAYEYFRDSLKISQYLKLRGEYLQNNGDDEKAMT